MLKIYTLDIECRANIQVIAPRDMAWDKIRALVEKEAESLLAQEGTLDVTCCRSERISLEEARGPGGFRVTDDRRALTEEEVDWIEGQVSG